MHTYYQTFPNLFQKFPLMVGVQKRKNNSKIFLGLLLQMTFYMKQYYLQGDTIYTHWDK